MAGLVHSPNRLEAGHIHPQLQRSTFAFSSEDAAPRSLLPEAWASKLGPQVPYVKEVPLHDGQRRESQGAELRVVAFLRVAPHERCRLLVREHLLVEVSAVEIVVGCLAEVAEHRLAPGVEWLGRRLDAARFVHLE